MSQLWASLVMGEDICRLEVGQVEAAHSRELAEVLLVPWLSQQRPSSGLELVGACPTFLATRSV
jgi:hypothetical protein